MHKVFWILLFKLKNPKYNYKFFKNNNILNNIKSDLYVCNNKS